LDRSTIYGTVVTMTALLAGICSIIAFLEDHTAESDTSEATIIVVYPGDNIPAIWRNNQVRDAFADGGEYYLVRYDRTLEKIPKNDYARLRGEVLSTSPA